MWVITIPESPEVEIVVRGLQVLVGQSFKSIEKISTRGDLIKIKPNLYTENVDSILGQRIEDITRRAKFIRFHFGNKMNLVIHLSYTGCFILDEKVIGTSNRFALDKIYYEIEVSNQKVWYLDPRGLSQWLIIPDDKLRFYDSFHTAGVDVVYSDASQIEKRLHDLKSRRILVPIKEVLLKQSYLAGIGNIYASESLFEAKIDPRRKLSELSDVEILTLSKSIKIIIDRAVKTGGSSTNDYFHVDGTKGSSQNNHKVYNKQTCVICGNKIIRIPQGQRSTYFCEGC